MTLSLSIHIVINFFKKFFEKPTFTKDNEKLSRVAINAFVKICEKWHLHHDESAKLLGVSERKVLHIMSNPHVYVLNDDELSRISYLLRIYRNLHIFFGDVNMQADTWVHLHNSHPLLSEHKSALKYMMKGDINNLKSVAEYSDEFADMMGGWG